MSSTSGCDHENLLAQELLEILTNDFLDIKEDAAHLYKCMQVLEIKISPYLEDRLCKPRDIYFRYRDSITAQFIYALFS